MSVGYFADTEEIIDHNEILQNAPISSNNDDTNQCNFIVASKEILEQRKKELSMDDFKLDHLNAREKKEISDILLKHYAAFSKSTKTLGHTDRIVPQIKFLNEFPIKTLPFSIPHALQAEAKEQIDQLVEAGIIERNCSEWACPILLVKKKPDGSGKTKYRLALDLRMLNSVIQGSSYPLPKIQNIIANLSSYKYFTSLDLQQAYHQIDMPEHLQDKLTFTSQFGSFKFKRLVFGLKSSASHFQALADMIIDEINCEGLYAYQDDFILGTNSFQETLQKLEKILSVFSKYNLTLAPGKCSFHHTSTNYLGFHIENHTVSPIQSNIVKITSFPIPKSKRQLKKFIGLATFYKNLIPAFSDIIHPLIQLTTPKATFRWTPEHNKIFNNIQRIFFSEPIVHLPDWNKKFLLNTDASKTAISAALLQEFGNKFLPVAYFSKTLSASEKRYPAIKLELMAIYKAVIAFKYYLYNRNFTILSDSAPLKHYKKTTNPVDITTKWLMELSEYSFNFEHIPGSSNVLADYLSRNDFRDNQETLETNPELLYESRNILPIIENDVDNIDTPHSQSLNYLIVGNSDKCKDPLLEISNQTFVNEQLKDSELSIIYQELLNNGKSDNYNMYFIHPDTKVLMFKKSTPYDSTFSYHIVVPHSLKAKVLAISHLSHFGLKKTYEFLTKRYFWKGIYTDTLNFVASCTKCLQYKHHKTQPAPLQPTYIPKYPGQVVAIDFVGPFNNGYSVLTVTDHFTRHLELYPMKDTSANKVVESLFRYFTCFGRPSVILSDLGSQFTSHVFNIFNETLGIKISHASVSHPQSNAIAERVNGSIKSSINTLLLEGHSFEHALLIHKCLYNGSTHSTTKFSPNLLHFGRELSLIFDTYDTHANQPFLDHVDTYKLMKDLDRLYQKAYQNNVAAQNDRNLRFSHRAKLRPLTVSDIVYLKSRDKFKPKKVGPYEIIMKHSPVSFTIRRYQCPYAPSFRVHIDRLLLAPPRKAYLDSIFNNRKNASEHNDNNFQQAITNNSSQTVTSRYNLRKRR